MVPNANGKVFIRIATTLLVAGLTLTLWLPGGLLTFTTSYSAPPCSGADPESALLTTLYGTIWPLLLPQTAVWHNIGSRPLSAHSQWSCMFEGWYTRLQQIKRGIQ